jgi:uncharacterized membrane protein
MEMRYVVSAVLVALAVALTWAFRPEQHNFEPTPPPSIERPVGS